MCPTTILAWEPLPLLQNLNKSDLHPAAEACLARPLGPDSRSLPPTIATARTGNLLGTTPASSAPDLPGGLYLQTIRHSYPTPSPMQEADGSAWRDPFKFRINRLSSWPSPLQACSLPPLNPQCTAARFSCQLGSAVAAVTINTSEGKGREVGSDRLVH